MTHRLTKKRKRRPREDATILAKLYPCSGQGIHNNITVYVRVDGHTSERTVAPALPHGGQMRFAGLAALTRRKQVSCR